MESERQTSGERALRLGVRKLETRLNYSQINEVFGAYSSITLVVSDLIVGITGTSKNGYNIYEIKCSRQCRRSPRPDLRNAVSEINDSQIVDDVSLLGKSPGESYVPNL